MNRYLLRSSRDVLGELELYDYDELADAATALYLKHTKFDPFQNQYPVKDIEEWMTSTKFTGHPSIIRQITKTITGIDDNEITALVIIIETWIEFDEPKDAMLFKLAWS